MVNPACVRKDLNSSLRRAAGIPKKQASKHGLTALIQHAEDACWKVSLP